jgi:[ribosomal protein S5]-alanine N-acetyltransferase
MNLPLETERTFIRLLTPADAPFMLALLNTPSWIKFIGERNVHTIADAENYIVNKFMKGHNDLGFGFYAVTLKTNNAPIGISGFLKRETLSDVDLGFAFLPEYEGQGYGFESALATLNYGRETLAFKRILAITVTYNQRSIDLLKKLNFEFDKIIRIPNDDEELMLFVNEIRK